MIGIALGWLVSEAPRDRAIALRALAGAFATVYLAARAPYLAGRHASGELAPVGVCSLLTAPVPSIAAWSLVVVGVVLGIAFTIGRAPRVVGPAFALVLLWVLTYANSWGKLLHSENLLLLHVGVLALAGRIDDERAAGWALRAASVATTLTYFVAGVTKLRIGSSAWLSGEALGDWLAWDALRKIELGSMHSPIAALVATRPAVLRLLAGFTLLVEIGAPVALVSRRFARVWVALAWLFHVGVLLTMAIGFFYPLSGIAFVPFLPVERLWATFRRGSARRPFARRGAA